MQDPVGYVISKSIMLSELIYEFKSLDSFQLSQLKSYHLLLTVPYDLGNNGVV